MDHALSQAAECLRLALRQAENAQKNLLHVARWAEQHKRPHLALGTRDLIEQLSKWKLDLASLVSVVRSQAENGQP